MSVLTLPSQKATVRPVPWRRMLWVTWRQHRGQARLPRLRRHPAGGAAELESVPIRSLWPMQLCAGACLLAASALLGAGTLRLVRRQAA